MAPPSPCTAEPMACPCNGQRIDRAPAILDDHVVDELDMAELVIDRDVGGMRAIGICVLLVQEGALGRDAFGRQPFQSDGLAAAGPTALLPSTISTSDGSQASRLAASARIAARRFSAASSMAEPPITTEREW